MQFAGGSWVLSIYSTFQDFMFLSSVSTVLKNYFCFVCDKKLFCSEIWSKAFAVLSACWWLWLNSIHFPPSLVEYIFYFLLQRGYTFLPSVLPYVNHIKHTHERLWVIFSDIWGRNPKLRRQIKHWTLWVKGLKILFDDFYISPEKH